MNRTRIQATLLTMFLALSGAAILIPAPAAIGESGGESALNVGQDGKKKNAGSSSRPRQPSRAGGSRPSSRSDGARPSSRSGGSRPSSRSDGARPSSRSDDARPSSRSDGARPPSRSDSARERSQSEAPSRAQQESQRRAQDAARQRAADEARSRAQQESQRRAQDTARQRAIDEARNRAQQESSSRVRDPRDVRTSRSGTLDRQPPSQIEPRETPRAIDRNSRDSRSRIMPKLRGDADSGDIRTPDRRSATIIIPRRSHTEDSRGRDATAQPRILPRDTDGSAARSPDNSNARTPRVLPKRTDSDTRIDARESERKPATIVIPRRSRDADESHERRTSIEPRGDTRSKDASTTDRRIERQPIKVTPRDTRAKIELPSRERSTRDLDRSDIRTLPKLERKEGESRQPRIINDLGDSDRKQHASDIRNSHRDISRRESQAKRITHSRHFDRRDHDRHDDAHHSKHIDKHVNIHKDVHIDKHVHHHHGRFHSKYRHIYYDPYRYPGWCYDGYRRSYSFGLYLSFGDYHGSRYGFSYYHHPYRWWYCRDWYSYHRPYYLSYCHGYAPVRYHYSYSYYRPWWYNRYCDWYYGSWYRPYHHVTKVVYETNYYRSGSTYGSYDSSYDLGTVYYDADADAPPTLDEAWSLLADGYLIEARDAFQAVGEAFPFEGEPQIGYAIATGLLNDREAAIFAMRKALGDDRESILNVPENLAIRNHISALVEMFSDQAQGEQLDGEAVFMIAALRFMLGEDAVAYFAVGELIDAGDSQPSTLNLRELIREQMYGRLFD